MQNAAAPRPGPRRYRFFGLVPRRLPNLQIDIYGNGARNAPTDTYVSYSRSAASRLKKSLLRSYIKFGYAFLYGLLMSMVAFFLATAICNYINYTKCYTHQTLRMPLACQPSHMDFKETEVNVTITMDTSCKPERSYQEPIPIDCELGTKLNQSVKEPGQVSCYIQIAEFKRWKEVVVRGADCDVEQSMTRVVVDVTRMYYYQCADTGKYENEEHIHIDHVFVTDKAAIIETSPKAKKLISYQMLTFPW
ncbi:uncharacterized protein LOC124357268 [Homalodisca vitripennis]|uniref:uncharacterized protein LOC124357268 n=1 Tax=Homalodisca vitripennis TaxID=197043 RepID=UPI001EEA8018|nr:uncharacterized protein LOC124357268 [Homalodisca vitripennis]